METFDPFIPIDRPATGLFRGIYGPSSGAALVVYEEGRGLRSLDSPADRVTAGEARFGKIRDYYRVDMTAHPLNFVATLPCSDDVGGFLATVRLQCQVHDPAGVVGAGIHDASSLIFPKIADLLRRVCQEFEAEDWKAAERASRGVLAELLPEDYLPFRISSASLELRLSDAAARYVEEHKESQRNLSRAKDSAALAEEHARSDAQIAGLREQLAQKNLELDKNRNEIEESLAKQRMELELKRESLRKEMEFQASKKLELEQLEFELEKQKRTAALDKQRVKVQLKLEKKQVKQLTSMLENGEFERLAIQLVQNPADIDRINGYLANRHGRDLDQQIEVFKALLETDAVEGWQVNSQGKMLLQRLLDNLSTRDPALPAGPTDAGASPVPGSAPPSPPTVRQIDGFPGNEADVGASPVLGSAPPSPPKVRQIDGFPGDDDPAPPQT